MVGELAHCQRTRLVDGGRLVGEKHGYQGWVGRENGKDGLDEAHDALKTDCDMLIPSTEMVWTGLHVGGNNKTRGFCVLGNVKERKL